MENLRVWNARLVPLFGFPLNALLLWLVLTKTPKEMRVHSRILLQTCIVDLILLLVNLIAIPLRIQYDLVIVTVFDGFFINLFGIIFRNDPKALMLLYFFVNVIILFDFYSVSVQFLYRYLVLNRDIKINIPRYLLMLLFPFVAALIIASLWYSIGIEGLADSNDQALKGPFNDIVDWDNSNYNFILLNPQRSLNIIWLSSWITFCIIFFLVNLFCGLKLVTFVHANNLNPNRKEMNRQLTKNIIILALFPLIFFISTLVISLSSSFYANEYPHSPKFVMKAQVLYGLMYCWLPVVNPLTSLWIIQPYRNGLIGIICFLKKHNNNAVAQE